LGIIIFFWVSSLNNFFSHLIPIGTPIGLIRFIVIVELLRNFIRPVALTFRLTANIMAGHLLMSLIGGFLISLPMGVFLVGSLVQSLLVFIELGVSFIQSYVFSVLIMLYISEIKN
jgi:F-type H+-transporting ATPase subunit a